MQTLEQLSERVVAKIDLSVDEARSAAAQLADESVAESQKGAFLLALAEKGESADEVAAFAAEFRERAVDPGVSEWAGRAIDVCGTGGDGSGTFNISTAVAFLLAAAGVPVFKHGNRSITSKCGSADLMESLGIELQPSADRLRDSLRELNFAFFFAPAYHPAFKSIMPVRKALAAEGKRTVFNLLGPLINPGRPAHQLLGVFSPVWVAPLAKALGTLGLRGGMVVHGQPAPGAALDELSCAGANICAGFGRLADAKGDIDPREFGLSACEVADLAGGGVEANRATLEALFGGRGNEVTGGLRDSVLLNAGAALWSAGVADDLRDGIDRAREILDSGRAGDWLARAQSFYGGAKA